MAHNASFERLWIGHGLGVDLPSLHDTRIMSQVLYTGTNAARAKQFSHSLQAVVQREQKREAGKGRTGVGLGRGGAHARAARVRRRPGRGRAAKAGRYAHAQDRPCRAAQDLRAGAGRVSHARGGKMHGVVAASGVRRTHGGRTLSEWLEP